MNLDITKSECEYFVLFYFKKFTSKHECCYIKQSYQ